MKKLGLLGLLLLVLMIGVLAIPSSVSYQGRLVSGGKLVNGTKSLSFKLYSVATGGTAVYTKTESVNAVKGLYQTDFPTSLFQKYNSLYLEVLVGTQVLSPRTEIKSSSYAVQAGSLEGVLPISKISNQAINSPNMALKSLGNSVDWVSLGSEFLAPSMNPFVDNLRQTTGVTTLNTLYTPTKWSHVFVTSESYTGNLGGIYGAHYKCNTDPHKLAGKNYEAAIYGNSAHYPNLGGTGLSDFSQPNQTGYYTTYKGYLWDYSLRTISAQQQDNSNFNNKIGSDYNYKGNLYNIEYQDGGSFYGNNLYSCNNWTSDSSTFSTSIFIRSYYFRYVGSVYGKPTISSYLFSCSLKNSLVCVETN